MTGRPATDQKIGNHARMTVKAWHRHTRRAEQEQESADVAAAELKRLQADAAKRFGLDIPPNALLLDVLELVDIEGEDVWRWRGVRNNKGLATVRTERNELSVVRYLAIAFGIIADDTWGMLYPNGDPDDVNPWHRTLRETAQPVGNGDRYSFGSLP